MRVFGIVGSSEQLIVDDNIKDFKVPAGMILMKEERPKPNCIATEEGEWEEVAEEPTDIQ